MRPGPTRPPRRRHAVLFLALGLLLPACAGVADTPGAPDAPPTGGPDRLCVPSPPVTARFAITDVTILPMTDDRELSGHTLIVESGRIRDLGPTHSTPVPAGFESIDGCGRYVLPGLADMHVHLSRADLPKYLSAGVTTVRNMWGYPGLRATIEDVDAGSLAGPTIHTVSPGLDGPPPKWPHTRLVTDPALAASVVDQLLAEGWTTLKVYDDLTAEVYAAIVEAARERRVDFVGHVPFRVGLNAALAAGQRSIEHLSGYEVELNPDGPRGAFGWTEIDTAKIEELAATTATSGTWNCPTLALFAGFARGDTRIVENRRRMVRALHERGARLLVGTDSGFELAEPGRALHDELAEFVASGFTPYEALRAATVDAAEFLGETDEFGQIAAGLRADFFLVPENPLTDVSAAAQPELVVVRGVAWQP